VKGENGGFRRRDGLGAAVFLLGADSGGKRGLFFSEVGRIRVAKEGCFLVKWGRRHKGGSVLVPMSRDKMF